MRPLPPSHSVSLGDSNAGHAQQKSTKWASKIKLLASGTKGTRLTTRPWACFSNLSGPQFPYLRVNFKTGFRPDACEVFQLEPGGQVSGLSETTSWLYLA